MKKMLCTTSEIFTVGRTSIDIVEKNNYIQEKLIDSVTHYDLKITMTTS